MVAVLFLFLGRPGVRGRLGRVEGRLLMSSSISATTDAWRVAEEISSILRGMGEMSSILAIEEFFEVWSFFGVVYVATCLMS